MHTVVAEGKFCRPLSYCVEFSIFNRFAVLKMIRSRYQYTFPYYFMNVEKENLLSPMLSSSEMFTWIYSHVQNMTSVLIEYVCSS